MTEQARDLSRGPTPQPTATGHASPAEPQPRSLIFLQKQFVCRQDAAHPPEWTFHGDFTSATFRALRKEEQESTPVLVASEQRAGTFRSGWEGPRCPWTSGVDPKEKNLLFTMETGLRLGNAGKLRRGEEGEWAGLLSAGESPALLVVPWPSGGRGTSQGLGLALQGGGRTSPLGTPCQPPQRQPRGQARQDQ